MAEITLTPTKTYNGNCHCGYFRFTLTTAPIEEVTVCNCSICFRKGYKWIFPLADGVTITHPTDNPTLDALETYTFGKKSTEHKFCPTCGTGVIAYRPEEEPGSDIAINVRTLQGIDALALPVGHYDGRSIQPAWNPKVIQDLESLNVNRYTGSCHCGNAKLVFSSPIPIDSNTNNQRHTECDCSVCVRNAALLTYPELLALYQEFRIPLTKYRFGKESEDEFCPVCGCQVRVSVIRKGGEKRIPINLRLFEGVKFDRLEVEKLNYKDAEPAYTLD